MKKKTIKQLEGEIAALRTLLSAEQTRYKEANARADELWHQLRNGNENSKNAEEKAHMAESELNSHRAKCLEYFMCIANPETAKDVERIKALQANICGSYYSPPCISTKSLYQ